MNDLCTDIGYQSLNKFGEQLCGDHVDTAECGGNSLLIVLADGLGSGVKASILSTLTAKIISTMMAASMKVEDCVGAIAAALPVCSVRRIAYSTFTIIRIIEGREAEIIQYDNPDVILLRGGKGTDYPIEKVCIDGKTILKSRLPVFEGDIFIALSDGAVHAGVGHSLNFGWQRRDIIKYMEPLCRTEATAKTLTNVLAGKCNELYGGRPGDDTTVCTVRIRSRKQVNLLIGPPADPQDCEKMMSLFFSKAGRHIVCGGTTASIAAAHLKKPLLPQLDFFDPKIPPTAKIDGVDLVTEGIITINRVLEYARDHLGKSDAYGHWSVGRDGASQISRLLFEEGTDINFFVGRAVNPAHQNPDLPIDFSLKMRLVDELAGCLEKMGKKIKVNYF
jgi:hypothetical protein